MPAPIITALPDAPSRLDEPLTFVTKADAWVEAAEALPSELNAFGAYLNGLGLEPADIPDHAIELDMSTGRMLGRITASEGSVEELTPAQVRGFALVEYYDANFTDDGEMIAYAHEAVTITEVATSGAGTVSYEKSTTAAPDTYSSATSPFSVQSGAKWKVIASGVSGSFAAHLKRTA